MKSSKSKGVAGPLASPSSSAALRAASFASWPSRNWRLAAATSTVSGFVFLTIVELPTHRRLFETSIGLNAPMPGQRQGGTVDQAAKPETPRFGCAAIQSRIDHRARQRTDCDGHRQIEEVAVGIE